jgi:hypothetical protein
MKTLFILALTIMLASILTVGCSKSTPATSPAPAPAPASALTAPLAVTTTSPITGGKYSWEEAFNHMGEIATVTGPIIDSFDWKAQAKSGDAVTLGMGKSFTDGNSFGIMIVMDLAKLPADYYRGETLSVTGEISATSKYQPVGTGAQMLVTDLSQIVVK